MKQWSAIGLTTSHRAFVESNCEPLQGQPGNVRFGSDADIQPCLSDVRFTPKSRHWLSVSECPLCAKSGHTQRSKMYRYSIISSASAERLGGTSMPSALAALRLMTNSNLLDCTTGKSPGFSPLRILPA